MDSSWGFLRHGRSMGWSWLSHGKWPLGICDLLQKVLIILHSQVIYILAPQNFFSVSLKDLHALFSIKHLAFSFPKELEYDRKRDTSQRPWHCWIESDGQRGVGVLTGPGVEVLLPTVRGDLKDVRFCLFKAQGTLSEVAKGHACQAHPSSTEIQGAFIFWGCWCSRKTETDNSAACFILKSNKKALAQVPAATSLWSPWDLGVPFLPFQLPG